MAYNDNLTEECRLLASYSTYKALYDEHKTVFNIISDFILDAVSKNSFRREYSIEDIAALLLKQYGIRVPRSIIRTTANHMPLFERENHAYFVKSDVLDSTSDFVQRRAEALNRADYVFKDFHQHLKNKGLSYDERSTDRALMDFLLDEQSNIDSELKEQISVFIIKNSVVSVDFCQSVNDIRRGHCLFTGLVNNDAVAEVNTWKTPLVIYLDMEILFHIVGYNGLLFQKIADDFIEIVNMANRTQNYIKLRFFSETKKEIEDYFYYVNCVLKSRDGFEEQKSAVRHLLKKCQTESDLLEEKNIFFAKLSRLGIYEDSSTNFNDDSLNKFNLESQEAFRKYSVDNGISDTDRESDKIYNRIRVVSNINKLRKGEFFYDYKDCISIFVTGTNQTIEISKDFVNNLRDEAIEGTTSLEDYHRPIEFAVSLSKITNVLWYRLNNTLNVGEKAIFPTETDAVLRARIVLAGLIQSNAEKLYATAKEKLERGEEDRDDIITRLAAVRKMQRDPDDISADTVDEDVILLDISELEQVENEKEILEVDNRRKDERIVELERSKVVEEEEIQKLSDAVNTLKRENDSFKAIGEIHRNNKMIRKYNEAALNRMKTRQRLSTIFVLIIAVFVFVIVKLIVTFGWDRFEQYSFFVPFLFSAVATIVSIFVGRKIDFDVLNIFEKIRQQFTKKYDEEVSVDAQKLVDRNNELRSLVCETDYEFSEIEIIDIDSRIDQKSFSASSILVTIVLATVLCIIVNLGINFFRDSILPAPTMDENLEQTAIEYDDIEENVELEDDSTAEVYYPDPIPVPMPQFIPVPNAYVENQYGEELVKYNIVKADAACS